MVSAVMTMDRVSPVASRMMPGRGGPYSAFVRSAKWPEICLWFARGCQKCLQFVLVLGLSADIFAASGAEASEPVEEQRRSGDFGL